MTRLKSTDLSGMITSLTKFDLQLGRQTGRDLAGIAAHAVGCDPKGFDLLESPPLVGVVTLTCGKGAISGFADTVAAIVGYLGANALVARATDAAGLAEACDRGAEVVMLSDDERFVAINLLTRRVSDNSVMTGKGFAAALDLMAGGLCGRSALVLGCGPVGRAGAVALTVFGARVTVFDPAVDRSRSLAADLLEKAKIRIEVARDLYSALAGNHYVIDATPADGFITAEAITSKTLIAAPGVPCGVTQTAATKLGDRLLFDPLRIGVASMLLDALQPEVATI